MKAFFKYKQNSVCLWNSVSGNSGYCLSIPRQALNKYIDSHLHRNEHSIDIKFIRLAPAKVSGLAFVPGLLQLGPLRLSVIPDFLNFGKSTSTLKSNELLISFALLRIYSLSWKRRKRAMIGLISFNFLPIL